MRALMQPSGTNFSSVNFPDALAGEGGTGMIVLSSPIPQPSDGFPRTVMVTGAFSGVNGWTDTVLVSLTDSGPEVSSAKQ